VIDLETNAPTKVANSVLVRSTHGIVDTCTWRMGVGMIGPLLQSLAACGLLNEQKSSTWDQPLALVMSIHATMASRIRWPMGRPAFVSGSTTKYPNSLGLV